MTEAPRYPQPEPVLNLSVRVHRDTLNADGRGQRQLPPRQEKPARKKTGAAYCYDDTPLPVEKPITVRDISQEGDDPLLKALAGGRR